MPHTARNIFLPLAFAALLTATSCRDHDGKLPASYESYRVDVTTYVGQDATGAVMELTGRDDNPSTTLHAAGYEPQDVAPGKRMLLSYSTTGLRNDGSKDIEVNGTSQISNDSLRVNTKELDSYPRHPIRLKSIWRTGEFINLHGQLEHTTKGQLLYLMADAATVPCDTVHAYVVNDLLDNDSTFFWREFYASINVGALIKRNTCSTLRVHVVDRLMPAVEHYDFTLPKSNNSNKTYQ